MGLIHPQSNNPLIHRIENEWLVCRDAAIRNNEGPHGPNRQHAKILERHLDELRAARELQSRTPRLSLVLAGMAIMAAFVLGALYWREIVQARKVSSSTDSVANKVPATKHKAPAKTNVFPTVKPQPQTRLPPRIVDPAITMQGRFYGTKLGGRFAHLDEGFNNYKYLSGTLARVQFLALKRRELAHQLPAVWINRTRNDCFPGPSIGIYNSRCKVIKLDYTDGGLVYEYPVEIEVALSHEWGHHLISISGVAMSPTEQEVVSDCFAGAVFGYYARRELIAEQDVIRTVKMMAHVGNNSAHGHHPNVETRLRSFAGGFYSVSEPSSARGVEFARFCATLHQIVDVAKIREMGLSWES